MKIWSQNLRFANIYRSFKNLCFQRRISKICQWSLHIWLRKLILSLNKLLIKQKEWENWLIWRCGTKMVFQRVNLSSWSCWSGYEYPLVKYLWCNYQKYYISWASHIILNIQIQYLEQQCIWTFWIWYFDW